MGQETVSQKKGIINFVETSRLLSGTEVRERPLWNTVASMDAIRHFAYGTSDDNPLWLDADYAAKSIAGRILAPPGFICSVLYPFLHGAPVAVPLTSLIGEVSVEWFRPIRLGDQMAAGIHQLEVSQSLDRQGRPMVFIPAETKYTNQHGELVAVAHGTVVRIAHEEGDSLLDREMSGYTESQRVAIRMALEFESRAGAAAPAGEEVHPGMLLPTFVRGPLSIGDLVCWQAGSGPSYRSGSLGYFDTLKEPHTTAINPITGWPLKYSQQHEDFLMAAQRGMPAPFDNSLMRFAWIAPMLTDWIGDAGFLKKLSVQTGAPLLYGDTTWYRGIVIGKTPGESVDRTEVAIRIVGVNQLGATTTTGSAVVVLPKTAPKPRPERPRPRFQGKVIAPSVLDLFASAVDRNPEAPAVVTSEEFLSFAELDGLSDRMAQHLIESGAKPGSIIGLLFPRSPHAIAAILAILKAGAAYFPLDVHATKKRLHAAITMAKPQLLFCAAEYVEKWDLTGFMAETTLVSWQDATLASSISFPQNLLNPATLAYVMPTSGSMGVQRCVAVSHGSLALYLQGLRSCFEVTPADRYLHSAPLTFSASVRQLFGSLCFGATIVLAGDAERVDPKLFLQLMQDTGVTVWDTVPSVWQTCLDTLTLMSPERPARLLDNQVRMILLTGEALRWKTVKTWRNTTDHPVRIYNLYSQTETAGTVCAFEIVDFKGEDGDTVPLGHPLDHVAITLKDVSGEHGDSGEICISGPRLAAGYLGNPEHTIERFALTPYCHEGFYRTGDQGRFMADGALKFVGRNDLRVKIRGQRVDLGEIENALKAHPGISDAVVNCFAEEEGTARLAAYIVCYPEVEPPTAGSLLEHLRGMLTEAALPARFITLDRLPRTTSGKVDRAELPAPERSNAAAPNASETVSSRVREIFLRALEVTSLGNEDKFFDVGGDSLMVMRVVAAIRETFGVDLPMQSFFDDPSVQGVSAVVSEEILPQPKENKPLRKLLVPLRSAKHGNGVFFIPGGWGEENEILVFAALIRHMGCKRPLYAIRSGALDHTPQASALADHAIHIVNELEENGLTEKITLIGECHGASVALAVNLEMTRRGYPMESLVLLDPGTINHLQSIQARITTGSADNPALSHSLPNSVAHYYSLLSQVVTEPIASPLHIIVSTRYANTEEINSSWQCLAKDSLKIHPVPGDHNTYIRKKAPAVAKVLDSILTPKSQNVLGSWLKKSFLGLSRVEFLA